MLAAQLNEWSVSELIPQQPGSQATRTTALNRQEET
jgi:hypothetical protein